MGLQCGIAGIAVGVKFNIGTYIYTYVYIYINYMKTYYIIMSHNGYIKSIIAGWDYLNLFDIIFFAITWTWTIIIFKHHANSNIHNY